MINKELYMTDKGIIPGRHVTIFCFFAKKAPNIQQKSTANA